MAPIVTEVAQFLRDISNPPLQEESFSEIAICSHAHKLLLNAMSEEKLGQGRAGHESPLELRGDE